MAAEVVIEGENAVDFGAGEVQRLGNERHRLVADETEFLIHRMQNGQQGAFEAQMLGDNQPCAVFIKDRRLGHVSTKTLLFPGSASMADYSALPINTLPAPRDKRSPSHVTYCPKLDGKTLSFLPASSIKRFRGVIAFFYRTSRYQ